MESPTLEASRRERIGKRVKQVRRQGQLPAILYGTGIEPVPIQLDDRETAKVMAGISGSTLIDLNLEGDTHKVLVRDVQRDPIRRNMLHVDFLKVAMDVLIRTEVPIELTGTAPAVKEQGGILVPGVNVIEVEALPGDLPDRLTVDLSVLLEIDDAITVGDLPIGSGVRILTDVEEIVAHVIYQAEEVEEEVEEEVLEVGAEPELVERGHREEEEEEGTQPEEEAAE